MVNPISSIQNVSSVVSHKSDAPQRVSSNESAYISTLRGMRSHRMPFGDSILQLLETIAFLSLLPVFIYSFFIASISLIFLPLFLILIPFVIIGDMMREILHTVLPFIFSDLRHRY